MRPFSLNALNDRAKLPNNFRYSSAPNLILFAFIANQPIGMLSSQQFDSLYSAVQIRAIVRCEGCISLRMADAIGQGGNDRFRVALCKQILPRLLLLARHSSIAGTSL